MTTEPLPDNTSVQELAPDDGLDERLVSCVMKESDGLYRMKGTIDLLILQPSFLFARWNHDTPHGDIPVYNPRGQFTCGRQAYLFFEEPTAVQNEEARFRMSYFSSLFKKAYEQKSDLVIRGEPSPIGYAIDGVPSLPTFRVHNVRDW